MCGKKNDRCDSLRFNTCFYEIGSCVVNSCDSFRQKLILDANDRKKRSWSVNWKWQMLTSQKMKKKDDQKFERILTENRKLLKFVKLIKLAVVIWMTTRAAKNSWPLIRLYAGGLSWHEGTVTLPEELLVICGRTFDAHKILTSAECCYHCSESPQSHMQRVKSMVKYVSSVRHKLMKIRKSLSFMNEQRFADC